MSNAKPFRDWTRRERIVFYTKRIAAEVLPKIESNRAHEADGAIHRLSGLVAKLHEELEP